MLKGAPRLLPNALPTPGPELHIPVLPGEVRELLAVRPGDTVVDCTFGGGGHAALLADDLHGRGHFVAIDRDPDATSQLEAFAHALPAGRRALGAAQLVRTCARGARRGAASARTRSCSTSASRRCSSISPSAGSPTRPTHRSTCGWIPTSSRAPPTLVNEWSEADLAAHLHALRRGALRPPDRPRDRPPPRRAAVPADARPRRHGARRDPDAGALRPGASGEARRSRRCASRSTTSSTELEEGLESAIEICEVGRADRRDLVPLARGPHRQASLPRGRARLHLPARPAGLRLRPPARVPRRQRARDPSDARPSSRATRAPRPAACGSPSARCAVVSAIRSPRPCPPRRPGTTRPDRAATAEGTRRARADRTELAADRRAARPLRDPARRRRVRPDRGDPPEHGPRSDLETRAGSSRRRTATCETQIQQAQSSPEVQANAAAPAAWCSRRPRYAHPLTGRPFTGG